MSGGSFGYLGQSAKTGNLFTHEHPRIQEMAEYLRSLGHDDAANATDALRLLLETADREAERLADVWKAAEWVRSCDWSPEQLGTAIAAWRRGRS